MFLDYLSYFIPGLPQLFIALGLAEIHKIEEYETTKKDRLLSKKQVAERIGVDRSTLWRWEKENYLVPIRFGKKVRYKESDIIEIEEGRR